MTYLAAYTIFVGAVDLAVRRCGVNFFMAGNAVWRVAYSIPVISPFPRTVYFLLRVTVRAYHLLFMVDVGFKPGVLSEVLGTDTAAMACGTCFFHGWSLYEGVTLQEAAARFGRAADMAFTAACVACPAVPVHGPVCKGGVPARAVKNPFPEGIKRPGRVVRVKGNIMTGRTCF